MRLISQDGISLDKLEDPPEFVLGPLRSTWALVSETLSYFSNGSPPFFPGSSPLVCLEYHNSLYTSFLASSKFIQCSNQHSIIQKYKSSHVFLGPSHGSPISQHSSLCFQHPQVLWDLLPVRHCDYFSCLHLYSSCSSLLSAWDTSPSPTPIHSF